jgi:BirA family biotin operon repressor/biotin-[acetyl-CoA-carboxylase] ligase
LSFAGYVAELRELRERSGHHGLENMVVLRSVASTNLLARDVALDYESEGIDLSPLLILAYEQSGGRGRQGRTWSSPAGQGVYATVLLPFSDPRPLQSLPLLVGVGLCRALAPHLPGGCRLKWPNDLLAGGAGQAAEEAGAGAGSARGRKLGGILIETLVRPGEPSVACIGFGVNRSLDGPDLPPGATSLAREGGGQASLAQLAWDLVGGVMRELAHAGDAAYAVDAYRALSIHRPGERMSCRSGDEVVEGVFLGFDEQGLLRLESGGREHLLSAGEVITP